MGFNVPDLPIKYSRAKTTHGTGLTIWSVPHAGLYRVLHINNDQFQISTLTQSGWIDLIDLTTADDNVNDPAQALQVWLDIQSSTDS